METPFSERFFLLFVPGAPELQIRVFVFLFSLVSLSGFDTWDPRVYVVVAVSAISAAETSVFSPA